MPKKRMPSETWYKNIRPIIWNRDKGQCIRCREEVSLKKCHIDHIRSGVFANNKLSNLVNEHTISAHHFQINPAYHLK